MEGTPVPWCGISWRPLRSSCEVRLTRFGTKGAVFYLALLGAFYASPYSNLFFLLLAFLTLQWCLSVVAAPRNLRGLEVEISELKPVPAGLALDVPIKVTADPRPRFQLSVKLRLEGCAAIQGEAECLAGGGQLSLKGPPLRRGCYRIQGASLESPYPFGLLLWKRRLPVAGELLVYPCPRSLIEGRSAADTLDELLERGNSGGEDLQPSGLRDHRDGDDVRLIHWRSSARSGRLVIREWEGGGGQGLEVLLDRRCAPEQLEEALSTLSAMVLLARENKETLALHSQSLSATFGEGHRPWIEALRFLALAQPLDGDGPAPPQVSPAVARLPKAIAHA